MNCVPRGSAVGIGVCLAGGISSNGASAGSGVGQEQPHWPRAAAPVLRSKTATSN